MSATHAPSLRAAAREFAHADDRRAWVEVSFTFALYLAGLITAIAAIGTWWVMVPAIVLASGSGLRLYMIQHDCLHGSFFSSRRVNDIIGTLLSPIAMTPYRATRHIHNLHHTHVSDLDRRDTFEIKVMTVDEWHAASPLKRLGYRLYRSPVTLILVGPFLLYTVFRRLPLYGLRVGWWDLVLHNAMIAAILLAIWSVAGWPGLAVWLAIVYVATPFGSLIPYVVHNFENINWGTKPELDFETAALEGSAVLDWGPFFDLAMLNIGYHDLHHLNAKIPGYRLKEAHEALEARGLLRSEKITFLDGLRCLRWKLYDEAGGRMVSFADVAPRPMVAAE
ncbi:MAG: fatty acid desaturase [Rhodobacteraceae bacterium]|nr:fatty acid desaturase [Paracoccaceae bacterium]